jgi:hypothetical protein
MSHFSVLVIGPAVAEQMQPFHEYESTGFNDQYVKDIDVTDEVLVEGLGYHGLEDLTLTDESQVDREGKHAHGFAVVDAEGNVLKAVNRTNPDAMWDWWVPGGRWSGFFKLKPGMAGINGQRSWTNKDEPEDKTRCDAAIKEAIDFEFMRNEAAERAARVWDRAAELHQNEPWLDWQTVRDAHADLEAARDAYANQPPIQRMRDDRDFNMANFLDGFDQYQVPRDRFIQQARDRALSTYAVVKDGVWHSHGEMGWFGFSKEYKSQEDWNAEVTAMLDALPSDTLLTIVDCHI